MIAVDTNLLVYAHRPEFPRHARAKEVLRGLAEGVDPWAIPLHCLIEFGGVVSHPRRFIEPSSPAQVAAQIGAWRSSPMCIVVGDHPTVVERWLRLLERSGVGGPAVHDARIAAACLVAGVDVLWTCDRDYSRFPELSTVNPLVSAHDD